MLYTRYMQRLLMNLIVLSLLTISVFGTISAHMTFENSLEWQKLGKDFPLTSRTNLQKCQTQKLNELEWKGPKL